MDSRGGPPTVPRVAARQRSPKGPGPHATDRHHHSRQRNAPTGADQPGGKAGASKPSGATTAGMARLTSAHTEGHDRRVRETRLPLAGPRWSPCRVVVGSPSLPLHPCLVVEESAVHRHAGLTEEFDDVGITSGDPGDVSLDRYLPAPGGDGRVHDDRSGVHTANGATGRPIPRAWASAGTLRCSRDGTHRQCREAAPRPVPGNGLSECPAACGAVRPSRSRAPMCRAHQAGSPTDTAPGTASSPGGSPGRTHRSVQPGRTPVCDGCKGAPGISAQPIGWLCPLDARALPVQGIPPPSPSRSPHPPLGRLAPCYRTE